MVIIIRNYLKNIFLTFLICICIFELLGCALLPRTSLDSNSGEIIESETVSGKYKIYIHPLDQSAINSNDKDKYLYKIGSHDQLSITVWGHPEFSSPSGYSQIAGNRSPTQGTLTSQINQTLVSSNVGQKAFAYDTGGGVYTVDEDGAVVLPLCGPIKVVGKTTKDIKKMVAEELGDYVVNPQVTVAMASYRSKYTFVVGEVNQSNMISLTDVPLDLASALSMSGWVNLSTADVKNIYVLRQGGGNDINVYR